MEILGNVQCKFSRESVATKVIPAIWWVVQLAIIIAAMVIIQPDHLTGYRAYLVICVFGAMIIISVVVMAELKYKVYSGTVTIVENNDKYEFYFTDKNKDKKTKHYTVDKKAIKFIFDEPVKELTITNKTSGHKQNEEDKKPKKSRNTIEFKVSHKTIKHDKIIELLENKGVEIIKLKQD
jgi:nitrogen fixation protein FixH